MLSAARTYAMLGNETLWDAAIETKLACGQGNLRRTHKDFVDVVELIAANELGRDFARHLHKTLRQTFRELVTHARGA